MGKKGVETLCCFGVPPTNVLSPPPSFHTNPSPKTRLAFLTLKRPSFLYNIENGEGGYSSQFKPKLKRNK